jgi:hypothetical protein
MSAPASAASPLEAARSEPVPCKSFAAAGADLVAGSRGGVVLVVTAIVVILQNGTRIASPAEISTHFFKSAISDTGPPTPVVAISLSAGRVIQQRGYPVTDGNGVGDRVEAVKTARWGSQMKPIGTTELQSPDLTRLQKIDAIENPEPLLSMRCQPCCTV